MKAGEGDEGRDVPPVHLKIPPPEIERGRQHQKDVAFRSRPPPLDSQEVPFKTAKGFANWLTYHFAEAGDPDGFFVVYMWFMRYNRNFKMRPLVRCARQRFRGMERLFFLQGLHIIATTIKQKQNIKRVFIAERAKLLMRKINANEIPPGADIPLPC